MRSPMLNRTHAIEYADVAPMATIIAIMPRKSSMTEAERDAVPTSLDRTPRSIMVLAVTPMLVAVRRAPITRLT